MFNQKKIFITTIILIFALIFIHEFVSNKKPPQNEALWKEEVEIIYKSSNQNLIIILPYMQLYQYATFDIFFKKLDYLLGYIQPFIDKEKTIVIFPKDIGKWLFTANENFKIHISNNEILGIFRFIIKHPFLFIKYYFSTFDIYKTLLHMKMNEMFEIYVNTFLKLAKKHNVTIIAGTVNIKEPIIKHNLLYLNENADISEFSLIISNKGLPIKIAYNDSENNILINNQPFKILFKELEIQNSNLEKSRLILYFNDNITQSLFYNTCNSYSCYYLPFRGKIWDKHYNQNIVLDSINYELQNKNYIFIY